MKTPESQTNVILIGDTEVEFNSERMIKRVLRKNLIDAADLKSSGDYKVLSSGEVGGKKGKLFLLGGNLIKEITAIKRLRDRLRVLAVTEEDYAKKLGRTPLEDKDNTKSVGSGYKLYALRQKGYDDAVEESARIKNNLLPNAESKFKQTLEDYNGVYHDLKAEKRSSSEMQQQASLEVKEKSEQLKELSKTIAIGDNTINFSGKLSDIQKNLEEVLKEAKLKAFDLGPESKEYADIEFTPGNKMKLFDAGEKLEDVFAAYKDSVINFNEFMADFERSQLYYNKNKNDRSDERVRELLEAFEHRRDVLKPLKEERLKQIKSQLANAVDGFNTLYQSIKLEKSMDNKPPLILSSAQRQPAVNVPNPNLSENVPNVSSTREPFVNIPNPTPEEREKFKEKPKGSKPEEKEEKEAKRPSSPRKKS